MSYIISHFQELRHLASLVFHFCMFCAGLGLMVMSLVEWYRRTKE